MPAWTGNVTLQHPLFQGFNQEEFDHAAVLMEPQSRRGEPQVSSGVETVGGGPAWPLQRGGWEEGVEQEHYLVSGWRVLESSGFTHT